MSFSRQSAIEDFLEKCGAPRETHFLKHWGRDGFFDDEVQKVLLERHPDNHKYRSPLEKGYPVHAWRVADQQAIGTIPYDATEIDALDIARIDRKWFARLTLAVIDWRERKAETERNPQTVFEKFMKWRDAHYLRETSRVTPIPPPDSNNAALSSIFGRDKVPNDPTGAIRIAIHKENKRRDGIMKKWAECWMVYLQMREPQQGAMDLAATMRARSGSVTKTPVKQ